MTKLLNENEPKIIFLQELWLPYHDQSVLDNYFPDYNFKIATPDMFLPAEDRLLHSGQVWHGAAVGWHRDIHTKMTPLPCTHDRLVGAKYCMADHSLLLISLYAPTSGQDDDFLESLPHLSQYIQLNTTKGDKVLIGTDSNCSNKSSKRRQLERHAKYRCNCIHVPIYCS